MCSDALGIIRVYDANDRYGLAGDEGVVAESSTASSWEVPPSIYLLPGCHSELEPVPKSHGRVGWQSLYRGGKREKMCHGVWGWTGRRFQLP